MTPHKLPLMAAPPSPPLLAFLIRDSDNKDTIFFDTGGVCSHIPSRDDTARVGHTVPSQLRARDSLILAANKIQSEFLIPEG